MQSQYPVIEAVLMGIRAMKTSPGVVARESYLGALRRARLCQGTKANDDSTKNLGPLHLRHAESIPNLLVQLHPHAVGMRQKYFHNPRIELPPRIFLYLRARRGNRQRLAIRTVGNHRIQRIRHRENSAP